MEILNARFHEGLLALRHVVAMVHYERVAMSTIDERCDMVFRKDL